MSFKLRNLTLAFVLLLSSATHAKAALSILDAASMNGLIPTDVANAAIKTFGIYFAHRPYQGAVSMFNTNSLDLKLEVTMMKIGDGIYKALAANGMGSSSSSTTALPIAKLHLRKALSPAVDVGISAISYKGQYAYGADVKIEIDNPEEGVNTAIRLGYTYAAASILYLKNLTVFSPEFVMSRKLDFVEPYLGVGGRYITGTVSMLFNVSPVPAFTVEKKGLGYTAYAFTGATFQILGAKGFRLGMEGTFDISGFSSIGTVFGIGF